jgi:hypothetical protein
MLKIAVKLQSWNIRRNLFARHESRASKTGVKLQFWNFRWDHIARDEGRTNGKNWCKLAILQRQTEMSEIAVIYSLETSDATFPHDMKAERQKLA